MPTCLLNMTKDVLSLLPGSVLGGMASKLAVAKAAADNVTANATQALFGKNGIITFDTENGVFKFVSDSSQFGLESNEEGFLKTMGSFLNAGAIAVQFGASLYNNIQTGINQIEDALQCIKDFRDEEASKGGLGSLAINLGSDYGYSDGQNLLAGGFCTGTGPGGEDLSSETTQESCVASGGIWTETMVDSPALGDPSEDALTQYALEKARIINAMDFSNGCKEQLSLIGEVFRERELDPTKEPCFLVEGGGTCNIKGKTSEDECLDAGGSWTPYTQGAPENFFSGTNLCALTKPQYDQLYLSVDEELEPCEIFDLVYGPPLSKDGQFILTVDGLYYDSQEGGVPDVIGFVPPADFYKFEQPANLGGKGTPITSDNFNLFVSSVFDPDHVDNSPEMRDYYKEDHFLQTLTGERDTHINQLNLELSSYANDGSSLAIIENKRQALYSQLSLHNNKIGRRKKQIEVAVKSYTLYGSTSAFTPGAIPINDFSYLKDLNIIPTLEQQKNIIFEQSEVCQVVLPIHPKFVKATEAESSFVAPHLLVPPIGKGAIIYNATVSAVSSTTTGVSGTANLYSLTDNIITDKLIGVYNFLEGITDSPSSTVYDVLNCASELNAYGNAQLLANEASSVYVSGLAIPRLKGLVRYNDSGTVKGLGSAVKLPDTSEYKDLLYNTQGCTIEMWTHVPGLESSSTSYIEPSGEWGPLTLNRILVGCENVGGDKVAVNPNSVVFDQGSESVGGFLMGFSRDQSITKDAAVDNALSDDVNSLSSLGFFIAPTMSYNTSNAGFVSKSVTESCDFTQSNVYKFFVKGDIAVSGKSFNDVSSTFMHICAVIDPSANALTVYLDGLPMGTSALPNVFGHTNGIPPSLPTFVHGNSFEYNPDTIQGPMYQDMQDQELAGGPPLNFFFTPWIIGGGYTDGLLKNTPEGFMGDFHGKKSGLNGYVGSVKFYSKPLNSKEVLQNYGAQRGFFKNIKT